MQARKHAMELAKSNSGVGDEAAVAADSVYHKLNEIAHALDHDVPVDEDGTPFTNVDGQTYPIGANLWVKRSDGSKSECTVKAYDPKEKMYAAAAS